MTNLFNLSKIQTKLISALLFLVLISNVVFSPKVEARLPDVVTNVPTQVAIDRTTPITVYFSYGSIASDSDIQNAVGSLTLNNSNLQFASAGFEDWYYGSPTRPDSENPPQQPACNSSYSGPKYRINPSLATNNSLTYGLQSARDTANPSGASTVDILREKHTGCIKVSLTVGSAATVGATTTLTFDPDAGTSPSYAEENRPSRQILNFTMGPATNPVSSTSSSTPTPPPSSSSVAPVSSSTPAPVSSARPPVTPQPTLPASSTPPTELARTGGLEVAAVLGLIALCVIGFIVYKVYHKRTTKIDVGGKKS